MNEEGLLIKNFNSEDTVSNKYPNAGNGLWKMFIAQLGMLVSPILMIVPFINLLIPFALIGFMVYDLVGLYQVGKDIRECKVAAIMQIVLTVLSIMDNFFNLSQIVSSGISIASTVINVVTIYLVCSSIAKVMKELNFDSAAKQAMRTWWIYLACGIIEIVIGIVMVITAVGVVMNTGLTAGIILILETLVMFVVSLISSIFYVIFLKNSAEHLGFY